MKRNPRCGTQPIRSVVRQYASALLVAAVALASLPGCAETPPEVDPQEAGCGGPYACAPEWTCVEEICLPACESVADCPAAPPCQTLTATGCEKGACRYQSEAEGTPCDDGDLCTETDICDAAGQCGGSAVLCDAPPPASCTANDTLFVQYAQSGECDPGTGSCTYQLFEALCPNCRNDCLLVCDGVSCPDEDCREAGRCVPSDPPSCAWNDRPDGTPCPLAGDPPDAPSGVCLAAACGACSSDAHCVDGDPCTLDICGADGTCSNPPADLPCDDGDPCTEDLCTGSGACEHPPFAVSTCDDGNPCTDDFCDGSGGCTTVDNSSSCDDGDPCTHSDVCASGVCAGALYSCTNPDPCAADVCLGDGSCAPGFLETCDIVDLTVVEALPESTAVAIGEVLSVAATVANLGNREALGPFDVALWASPDPTFATAVTELVIVPFTSLAASTQQVESLSHTLVEEVTDATTYLAPGSYSLAVVVDPTDLIVEHDESNNLFAVGTFDVARDVDLVVSSLSPATLAIDAGQPIPIAYEITNLGSSAATARMDLTFYLSADAVWDASDTVLARVVQPPVPGNTMMRGWRNQTTSTADEPGDYTLFVWVDSPNRFTGLDAQPETDENNNLASLSVSIARDVDLLVADLTLPSNTMYLGHYLYPTIFVENRGTTASKGVAEIRIYLSTDNIITTGDIYIGRVGTGQTSFDPGSVTPVESTNSNLNIRTSTAAGDYFIGAIVDATSRQPESDETNNVFCGPAVVVTSPPVDLVVSSIVAPTTVYTGQSASFETTVTNQGTMATTRLGAMGEIRLSVDNIITTADTRLGTYYTAELAGGESRTVVSSYTIPKDQTPGVVYAGSLLDTATFDRQAESDETNNIFVGPTVNVVRDIDLVVTEIAVGVASVTNGTDLGVRYGIRNNGVSPTVTGNVEVSFYLSTDGIIDATDVLLGSKSLSSLDGGVGRTEILLLTVPAGLVAGSYFVVAVVDGASIQPETDETNNALAGNSVEVL